MTTHFPSFLLYGILQIVTFGWAGHTKWAAKLIGDDVFSVFQWIESRDLEDKIYAIENHYRTDTSPNSLSFWKSGGEWQGGIFDQEGEVVHIIYISLNCPYLKRRKKEVFDQLAEHAEPWWNNVDYDSSIPDFSAVYKMEVFELLVEEGYLTDGDGFGLLVKDGHASKDYKVLPSNLPEVADDATHIAWISK